jgi:hypothetical protein
VHAGKKAAEPSALAFAVRTVEGNLRCFHFRLNVNQ